MKTKNILLIVLGILLFIGGIILNNYNKPAPPVVIDNTLNKSGAKSIANSLVKNVIYVYEKPSSIFDVDEVTNEDGSKKIIIKNYDDKLKEIFTDNGIKQLENMTFKNQKLINKENDTITINSVIPNSNKFINSSYSISEIKLSKDYFTCKVNFYKASTDEKDTLVYYAITKNMKIVKSGDTYLVDSIIYSND
jgi:hypothetical protein